MSSPQKAPGIRRPLFRFPFHFIAASILVCSCAAVVIELIARTAMHRWLTLADVLTLDPFMQSADDFAWVVVAVLYASIRTTRYHPTLHPSYTAWLASTPWRQGLPLPVGPPYLVWEDLAPAALTAALCASPSYPLTAFALGYAILALRVSRAGRDAKWVRAVLLTLAASLVLIWPSSLIVCAIDLAILIAAELAVRRSLFDLPWTRPVALAALTAKADLKKSDWPLAPLLPKSPIAATDGWAIAMVAAWIVYCLLSRALQENPQDINNAAMWVALPLLIASLLRWSIYCGMYRPPISILGRIVSLRLIIPGYDNALIAPFAAALCSVGIPAGFWMTGHKDPRVLAAVTLIVTAIIFNAGPTLSRWQLTGHHRIVLKRHRPIRGKDPERWNRTTGV